MDFNFTSYAKFAGLGLAGVAAAVLALGMGNMKEEEDKSAKNMTITAITLLGIYALLQGYLIIGDPANTAISSLIVLGGCMLQIIALSLLGASFTQVDTSMKGLYVLAMIIVAANILLTIIQSGDYMCDAWFAKRAFRG